MENHRIPHPFALLLIQAEVMFEFFQGHADQPEIEVYRACP
jgi:hypothetical protein